MSCTLLALAFVGTGKVEAQYPSHEEISPVVVTARRLPDFGDPMEMSRRSMEERLLAKRPAEIRQLEKSRALWFEKRIRSYRYTVSSRSDAWGVRTTPMIVTVRNGQVFSTEYAPSQTQATAAKSWSSTPPTVMMDIQPYSSIPKLFAIVERMLSEPLTVVAVQYDAKYGYPTSISTDQWDVSDDEGSIYVSSFQVLD